MRNRLQQLLNDNRGRGMSGRGDGRRDEVGRIIVQPTEVGAPRVVSNATKDEATVYLYDMIVLTAIEAEFWGGVSPEPFAKQLAAITAGTIHLRINSPGGDVFAARAIEQTLREHPANIIVHVDGLAASAASIVAMAGDEVRIAAAAMFMIHRAHTLGVGNADDFLDLAGLLEKIDGTIADTYAKKTGKDRAELLTMMAAETWLTAAEAVEAGFADRLAGEPAEEPDNAKASADLWNLAAFGKAAPTKREPEAKRAAAPTAPAPAAAAPAIDTTHEHARIRARLLASKFA